MNSILRAQIFSGVLTAIFGDFPLKFKFLSLRVEMVPERLTSSTLHAFHSAEDGGKTSRG